MTDRKEFRDLAPPERAREAIDSLNLEPSSETVPLEDASGARSRNSLRSVTRTPPG